MDTVADLIGHFRPGTTIRTAYLHVPFCFHKCHYCDFYSLVDTRDRQGAFTRRLVEELDAAAIHLRPPLETIFVGGGTPTLLAVEHWQRILETIARHGLVSPDTEFTVEANPETVTPELLEVLTAGGVNRMSIGAQSFDPGHLSTLERWHEPDNVDRSVTLARSAGIESINLDLIYAVPKQTLDEMRRDLDRAVALGPDHLSCYALTYEPNTPMTARLAAGRFDRTGESLEAAMFDEVIDRLAAAGFEQYEISNFARPGHRCRHNLTYWENGNFWPFGPSGAGHVDGWRWRNRARIGDWLKHGPFAPIEQVERLDDDGRVGERFMLGLRCMDGLSLDLVDRMIEQGERGSIRRQAIERQVGAGRLVRSDGRLRLTRSGQMVADDVVGELLA